MDQLTGKLVRISYRSPDGEFLVARLLVRQADEVTITGPQSAPHPLTEGVTYTLHGNWHDHPQHGRQYRYSAAIPHQHDQRGVVAYLTSTCPGIGQTRAARLWDAFGSEAVAILRDNPAQVVAREILSPALAKEASQALHDAGAWQDTHIALLGLLHGRGFQLGQVIPRCIRLWRRRAPEVVRRNPYTLMLRKIPSCGWERCDKLYLDLGHNPAALKRQALAAIQLLKQADGDTWLPAGDLARAITAALKGDPSLARPHEALRLAERARLITVRRPTDRDGKPIEGPRYIALAQHARDEVYIASTLKEMMAWTPQKRPCVSTLRQRLLAEITLAGGTPPGSMPTTLKNGGYGPTI